MKIHDVQTLAMLVCVFWNRENAIVNPPKKDRALPQSTSMDYVPPCVSYIVDTVMQIKTYLENKDYFQVTWFYQIIVLGPPVFVPLANDMAKEYFQLDWTKSNCFKIIFILEARYREIWF